MSVTIDLTHFLQWLIPVHKCASSKMKCCVKRLSPEGIPFNTSVWMLAAVKIALVHV